MPVIGEPSEMRQFFATAHRFTGKTLPEYHFSRIGERKKSFNQTAFSKLARALHLPLQDYLQRLWPCPWN